MSNETIATVETTSAKKSAAPKKSAKGGAKKIDKRHAAQRFASNAKTGGALKFIKLGAFGGRGARTSAIENVIASAGAKGASIREIEQKTNALAVAMHVRTLYTGARGAQFIGRKRRDSDGAYVYFALKAPKTVKRVAAAK